MPQGPGGVISFLGKNPLPPHSAVEPTAKRTVVFIDGQNLFHCVREAFGYSYPNYDVMRLARTVVSQQPGCQLCQVRFYTGIPDARDEPFWHNFWAKKLLAIRRQGVWVFTRPLRYRNRGIKLRDGVTIWRRLGEEKGIDVRMAIDVIRLAHARSYDFAIIFSQDQDLSEAADEIRKIAREQRRWIRIASAFPKGSNSRGINKTDWLQIDRPTYEACIDPFDYRPPPTQPR